MLWVIRPIAALDVLCAQLTRDLFVIAKFLLVLRTVLKSFLLSPASRLLQRSMAWRCPVNRREWCNSVVVIYAQQRCPVLKVACPSVIAATPWAALLLYIDLVANDAHNSWPLYVPPAVNTRIDNGQINPVDSTGKYSAASKLVHWPLVGGLLHLVQRGGAWASCGPAQSPPRCTKCNSPPINGQCTNHCIAIWWSVVLRF